MICWRSIVDFVEPIILRIMRDETNCPILFWMGEIASTRSLSVYVSNSYFQKLYKTSSCTFSSCLSRHLLSDSRRRASARVASGSSRSVSMVLRRIYSSRGPQLLAYSLPNIATIPDATRSFCWLCLTSSTFIANGRSVSNGSRYTTSFMRRFGI